MTIVDFGDEDTQVRTEPRDSAPPDSVYDVVWEETHGEWVLRVTPVVRAELRS
jgi:hypothetical protein